MTTQIPDSLIMEREAAFGSFSLDSTPIKNISSSGLNPTKTAVRTGTMTNSFHGKSTDRYLVIKPAASSVTAATAATAGTASASKDNGRVHPWGPDAQGLPDVATQAGETASCSTQTDYTFSRPNNNKRFGSKQQTQKLKQPTSTSATKQPTSRISKVLRFDQEALQEDFYTANIRQGIEMARLNHVYAWKTPYEVDAPRAIMLPSRENESFSSSTSSLQQQQQQSNSSLDPATVEARIWKGIEQLMVDTFSSDGDDTDSWQREESSILPQALVRAISQHSLFSAPSSHQDQTLPPIDPMDEFEMAQAALSSFMDMIVPTTPNRDLDSFSLPTLTSASAPSDDDDNDDTGLVEVALHNFMNLLLQQVEGSESSNNSAKSSGMQLLDLFQWTVRQNVDAQERHAFLQQQREKELTDRIRQQQEEIKILKRQEEEELRQLQEQEERLRTSLEHEREEEMIMAQLEEQELALQQKMEEIKAASRMKGGLGEASEAVRRKLPTPSDRRRSTRTGAVEDSNPQEDQVETLRAKIAEAERMLIEEQEDLNNTTERRASTKKKRSKKNSVPFESPFLVALDPMASPRQISSSTIPSLSETIEGDNRESYSQMPQWDNLNTKPISMRSENEWEASMDMSTLPNLQAQKNKVLLSSSGSSNIHSKSSGEIARRKSIAAANLSDLSDKSAKSVPSYLPSTSNQRSIFGYQQSDESIDPTTLPNLAATRSARSTQAQQRTKPAHHWAAIGGRPIVMSNTGSQQGADGEGEPSVKSSLLPSPFYEIDQVNGVSTSTKSSTPSLTVRIASTVTTTSMKAAGIAIEEEHVDELPELKSISAGSMSERTSTSSSESSNSSSDSSDSTSDSSTTSSSSDSSSSSSKVPSNAASSTPSYIVEERVEHAEGSRGPMPDYALVFSDSFMKSTKLLPSRSESESESDSAREFPRFFQSALEIPRMFRAPSPKNLAVLSEVTMVDDASHHSLDHLSPRTSRRAELARQLSHHTNICSIDGAGDLHIPLAVSFEYTDDDDDVTLDPELQADERRYGGERRYVPAIKRRRQSLGSCIRNSLKVVRTLCQTRQRPKLKHTLSSQRCLLHSEEETYDESNILSDPSLEYLIHYEAGLTGIDEYGFMVA